LWSFNAGFIGLIGFCGCDSDSVLGGCFGFSIVEAIARFGVVVSDRA